MKFPLPHPFFSAGTKKYPAYVNGNWVSTSQQFISGVHCSGIGWYEVADCGPSEMKDAVLSSLRYLDHHFRASMQERRNLLLKWRTLILDRTKMLAELLVSETGKPIDHARQEVLIASSHIAHICDELAQRYGKMSGYSSDAAPCQPKGIAFGMLGQGRPVADFAHMFCAPYAAGCPVVLMPAKEAPITGLFMAQLWEACGGAQGSLHVLSTSNPDAVLHSMVDEPQVARLGLKDTREVGNLLSAKAHKMVQRATYSLADNVLFLVWDDANLQLAASSAISFRIQENGHLPVRVKTLYVHQAVAACFANVVTAHLGRLVAGTPYQTGTDIGSFLNNAAREELTHAIDEAICLGAEMFHRPGIGGWPPFVLYDVAPDALLLREDFYGPVLPVVTFKDINHLQQLLVSQIPLGMTIWSEDTSMLQKVVPLLDIQPAVQNSYQEFLPDLHYRKTTDAALGEDRFEWNIDDFLQQK